MKSVTVVRSAPICPTVLQIALVQESVLHALKAIIITKELAKRAALCRTAVTNALTKVSAHSA